MFHLPDAISLLIWRRLLDCSLNFENALTVKYRTYAVREKIPEIRGTCAARPPYFRAPLTQLRKT